MRVILFLSLFISLNATAGGYSKWAVPTMVEYVNDGVLIFGEFGNPNNCPDADKVFIARGNIGTDTKFNALVSMVMSGFIAQKEMRFRADNCFNVTFHGNVVSESRTAVYIR